MYIHIVSSGIWTRVPDMLYSHYDHSCGPLSGGSEIIVAGGYLKSETEILDTERDEHSRFTGNNKKAEETLARLFTLKMEILDVQRFPKVVFWFARLISLPCEELHKWFY